MRKSRYLPLLLLLVALAGLTLRLGHRSRRAEALLAGLRAVGRDGAGNVAAADAWQRLVRKGPAALLPALAALDGADATSANWIRAAVDAIAEQGLAADRGLPAAQLEVFVLDRRHAGRARRLAYEWLTRVDASAAGRLIPGMLDDASAELRRDAVALVLAAAQRSLDAADTPGAVAGYQQALAAARDHDQVGQCAARLKELGIAVDLAAHFGFVSRWRLLGPFDNTKGAGYDTALPPETLIDLGAVYLGKQGVGLRWGPHTTTAPEGVVDLNRALGKQPNVTAYALAVVASAVEQPVEVRVGSINAIKVFLNGKLVIACEEYHHEMAMDQYVGRGRLRAGRNEILVKVCQDNEPEDFNQDWRFQLRLCDALGAAVPVAVIAEEP